MNDRAIIRSFETGWGRRVAILAAVIAVLALLLGVVIYGFRDRRIRRNTDALTHTHETTTPATTPQGTPPFPSR